MPTIYERKCTGCGAEILTASKKERCVKCSSTERTSAKIIAERGILENLGYTNILEPQLNNFSQRVWTFTHVCGEQQTWTFGNLQTRLKKDPTNVPCSFCGAKRRTEKMNAA